MRFHAYQMKKGNTKKHPTLKGYVSCPKCGEYNLSTARYCKRYHHLDVR